MFKRIFWFTVGIMVALIGLFFLMGKLADPIYEGSKSVVLDAPIADVWSVISDKGQTETNFVDKQTGFLFQEIKNKVGASSFQIVDEQPMKSIKIEMVENQFGIKGTWLYEFEDEGDKTKVTITENSVTEGLFTRSVMTILGRDSQLDLHIKALKNVTENDI